MKYICDICGKEFGNINGCKTHYCRKHSPTQEEKQQFFTSLHEKHLCPICGKQILYNLNGSRLFNKTCSVECSIKLSTLKLIESFNRNPSKRIEKRQQRLEYLAKKEHFALTAWGRRSNKEASYLEQWFIENVLEKNANILNKFDIISEYHFLGYSCDFAFLNIHLDVELDGRQHFINGKKRAEHDCVRDDEFVNNGWKIYRITYKEVEETPNKVVQDFMNFIGKIKECPSKRYDYGLYIKNRELMAVNKRVKKKNKEENERLNFLRRKKEICDVINNVDFIDYTKQGWVEKLKEVFEKHNILYDKNLSRLLHKYYPEFFTDNKVFYRKGSKYATCDE